MKLAEALNLRSNLQIRINEFEMRFNNNAMIQEGGEPFEDPEKLNKEFEECTAQLEELISRINLTNCKTVIKISDSESLTLTELLAKRDCLKIKVSAYSKLLHSATTVFTRSTKTEIRYISAISVPEYRKKLDDISEQLRKIDVLIQEANWTTELV